jgi:hypothetical protein
MTDIGEKKFIATVWRFNAESGWCREIYRQWAENPVVFRILIERESADDEIYIGPISVMKDQTL